MIRIANFNRSFFFILEVISLLKIRLDSGSPKYIYLTRNLNINFPFIIVQSYLNQNNEGLKPFSKLPFENKKVQINPELNKLIAYLDKC